MDELDKVLQDVINKKNIYKNEPMSKHTSFKIGGIADYFIKITSVEELKSLFKISKKYNMPITLVGNGTNLLVRDGGIRGFVVKIDMNNFKIKRTTKDIEITVESGMTLAALANVALKEEITGLEFLSGIPGTIGGALRMNAGAYGGEMKDVVVKTRYITYDGKIKTMTLPEHKFEYRNSVFSKLNVIILDTTLKLSKGNKKEIDAKMKEFAASRKEKQPLEYPNAGSTFKRKEGFITAKLIDDAGLKGYNVGDAEVSTKHAGFVVNKGKATAKDVLELVEHIKKTIKEKKDLDIELEIIVLGDEK